MLSFRNCIVLPFIFRSIIHLEFIFHRWKCRSRFIFSHMDGQFKTTEKLLASPLCNDSLVFSIHSSSSFCSVFCLLLCQYHTFLKKIYAFLFYYFIFLTSPWVMWKEIPRPRMKPTPPAVEARSLNLWTTREVQYHSFNKRYNKSIW